MYFVTIYDGPEDSKGTVIHSPYNGKLKLSEGQAIIKLEGISEFSFSVNRDNPAFNKVKPYVTIVQITHAVTGKKIFDGRVVKPTHEMNTNGLFIEKYFCEHVKGYLYDSAQRHQEIHNTSIRNFFQMILNRHNATVETHKRFQIGNVTVTNSTDNVYRYLGYEKTYSTIKDKLIDRLGGFLVVREENGTRYLDYLAEVGEYKDTPIEIRKNLREVTREVDPTNVFTRLVPLGEEIESEDDEDTDASKARIDIKSVNNGKDYIESMTLIDEFGLIEKTEVFDDVTVPANVLSKGREMLNNQKAVIESWEVDALQIPGQAIDTFEVGNHHQFINPMIASEQWIQIIEMKINVVQPVASSMIIGEKSKTLSQYQAENQKKAQQITQLETNIVQQRRNAARLKKGLEETERNLSELKELVNSGNSDVQNQISSILDELQIIVGEMGNIAASVPSAEYLQGIQTAISNLNDFVDAQGLINTDLEDRIKALEPQEGEDD